MRDEDSYCSICNRNACGCSRDQLDCIEDSLQTVRKLLIQLDKNIGERHLELLERLVVNDKAGG